jgi:predicted small secreted protein
LIVRRFAFDPAPENDQQDSRGPRASRAAPGAKASRRRARNSGRAVSFGRHDARARVAGCSAHRTEEFAMTFSRTARIVGLLLALAAPVLAACNTMEGAGKDIERGGEKLQDSANHTKQKM